MAVVEVDCDPGHTFSHSLEITSQNHGKDRLAYSSAVALGLSSQLTLFLTVREDHSTQ